MPGAHHYRIHVYESSREPARARTNADRLRTLVPGSGHLLHMPSHIDMRDRALRRRREGQRALDCRRRALSRASSTRRAPIGSATSRTTTTSSGRPRRWTGAAQSRAKARGRCVAVGLRTGTGRPRHRDPAALLRAPALCAGPLRPLARRSSPTRCRPDVTEPYPLAIWHYARGTAYAKTGRLAQARTELARARSESPRIPALERARIKNINAASALVRIAVLTLQADIASASERSRGGRASC